MNVRNRLGSYAASVAAPKLTLNQQSELQRLFAECEAELQGFVFALLPHWPDVDDVLQRTRIVAWQKFDQFQPGSSFRSWAMQIARHEVSNFRRTQQRDRLCFDDVVVGSLAEARANLSEELEGQRLALEACFRKLRSSDRQIIRQCYGPSATSMKAAAERLHRPVNTVYKALNRIRRTLMECVQLTAGRR